MQLLIVQCNGNCGTFEWQIALLQINSKDIEKKKVYDELNFVSFQAEASAPIFLRKSIFCLFSLLLDHTCPKGNRKYDELKSDELD